MGVLLLFMGLFLYLPRLIKPYTQPLQQSDTAWLNGLNYMDSGKNQHFQTANVNSTRPKPAYFYFDPNTATELQLLTLGLTPKNVQTILNYRNKGGQFRLPEDFLKIWGIKTAVAKALIPFIRIALPKGPQRNPGFNNSGSYNPTYSPKKIPILDINLASIEEWEALPGIGPVLAKRIVKYREKLGGFTETADISKTYGISDSLFNQLQPFLQVSNMGKPSINTASVALLQKAGVSSAIAVAIVEYRKQYGLFASLEELKKIVFIQPAQFQELLLLVKL